VLLFCGYGMALHSAPSALLMLGVCALYYRSRTALEAEVLSEAFGEQYKAYAKRTKKFLPWLV
jgi:protein-S-isoprenylcysteine O-methyltransferase Ste14